MYERTASSAERNKSMSLHGSFPECPLFQDKEIHKHRDRNIEEERQEFGHTHHVDLESGEDIFEDYATECSRCVTPEEGLEFIFWDSVSVKVHIICSGENSTKRSG